MFLVSKDYFIGQNKNLYCLVKILLKLAEVNFYLLRTASVRDSNFCHTPYSFFVFYFYDCASSCSTMSAAIKIGQIFSATLSFALRAQGLLTISVLSATIGFFVIMRNLDSKPLLLSSLKYSLTSRSSRL